MFRGSPRRTGVSGSRLSCRPLLLWVTEIGPSVSSPLFEDGTIYISTITGRIFAINLVQKRIKWQRDIGSPVVSSPLVHNKMLVAATYDSWIKDIKSRGKNFVFGINVEDGTQLWCCEISGNIFSSPCIIDNASIVVGSTKGGIYAIDVRNGNVRWVFKTEGEVWSSPSYNGKEIFTGCDDGFIYCLDLDGKLRWKTNLNGKVRSSTPCLSSGDDDEDQNSFIFVGTYSGGMFCLNQSTGMIKWSKSILKPVMASPATIKDKVFFAASDNKIYCFQVDDGSKIWSFETDERIWSSPCLTEQGGTIFFGSLDSHIYGIDIDSGSQTWKFPTMSMIDSSPAIASGMMFIGSRDGLLYVFGPPAMPSYIT
jgi:eukaryotic-like serine/threonine-protein kinase